MSAACSNAPIPFKEGWRTAARCNCRCISRSIASGSTHSWTGGDADFASWQERAAPEEDCIFLCELGPRDYAITGANGEELSDRWSEALLLKEWAARCWADAGRAPAALRVTPRRMKASWNVSAKRERGGFDVCRQSAASKSDRAEWEQRVELAACYRLLAHYKMTDLIYTHATARVPGEPGHFLINPYGYRWEEITASSLVKIDVDGNKIGDSPHRVNPAGFTIHSAVHMARHDAACVIHTHTRAGMAVSAVKDGLLPISQIALQFYGRLGIHEYEGIALDLDERQRIIRDFGGYCGVILRNHGLLTVGRHGGGSFQPDVLSEYAPARCRSRPCRWAPNSSFRLGKFASGSASNMIRWPSTTAISNSNGRRICVCSTRSTLPIGRDFSF